MKFSVRFSFEKFIMFGFAWDDEFVLAFGPLMITIDKC